MKGTYWFPSPSDVQFPFQLPVDPLTKYNVEQDGNKNKELNIITFCTELGGWVAGNTTNYVLAVL